MARTITNAMEWLQLHYEEDFFLYIDTWDPHEPWDAPDYYTKLYMPDYDGELVHPIYGRWHEMPGYSAELVDKAHATYCGEVTMVDTWVGYLLRMVKNMGLNGQHGDHLHDRPRLLLRGARRLVRQAPIRQEAGRVALPVWGIGRHLGLFSAV